MPAPAATAPSPSESEGRLQPLAETLEALARVYAPAATMTDPLALIIWENVGYLIPDDRRQALFDELSRRVGLEAARLADAPGDILFDIARRGGMRPADRVDRLRRIGQLAVEAGGDLASAIRVAGPAKARSLLKRFPGIADPGADKILLFTGALAQPALESNGVRVLVRLGHASEGASYVQAYRGAISALRALGPPDRERLVQAFQLLRAHGQALCKRAAPLCLSCPLDRVCAHTVTTSV